MSHSFIASPNLFYARINLLVFQYTSLRLGAHCRGCSRAGGEEIGRRATQCCHQPGRQGSFISLIFGFDNSKIIVRSRISIYF